MDRPSSAHAALGLGCATFGREIDAAAAFAIMDFALERGINHFDTAPSYGDGASERVIGQWLTYRSPVVAPRIATKVKPPYTAAAIHQSVDASRGRLGRDRLDLLYLHQWDPTALNYDVIKALESLVASGAIGSVGASNVEQTQIQALHHALASSSRVTLRAIQNNHNFAVRTVDRAMTQYCRNHTIDIVTYSPLGAGFLTGKHSQGVQQGSRFQLLPAHQDIYFQSEAQRRLVELQALAAQTGISSTTLALAWAMRHPGTAMVLIGARSTGHLAQALAARDADVHSPQTSME